MLSLCLMTESTFVSLAVCTHRGYCVSCVLGSTTQPTETWRWIRHCFCLPGIHSFMGGSRKRGENRNVNKPIGCVYKIRVEEILGLQSLRKQRLLTEGTEEEHDWGEVWRVWFLLMGKIWSKAISHWRNNDRAWQGGRAWCPEEHVKGDEAVWTGWWRSQCPSELIVFSVEVCEKETSMLRLCLNFGGRWDWDWERPEDGETDQQAIAVVLGRSDEGWKGEWEQLSSTFNPHRELILANSRWWQGWRQFSITGFLWLDLGTYHLNSPLCSAYVTASVHLDKLLDISGFPFHQQCGYVGMLYAFVWVLAYSWHEIIVNNIANTSANILQDLQKSQHPQLLNILNMRKHILNMSNKRVTLFC